MADESHAHVTAAKARWQGIVIGLVVGILLGAILGVMLPELQRQPPGAPAMPGKSVRRVQDTPILVSVSGEGESRALELRSNHRERLENVVVEVTRADNSDADRCPVGTLGPAATRTLGAEDWAWKVRSGDLVEVSAEGFASITYTAP